MKTLIIFSAFVALVSLVTVSGSERVIRQIAGGVSKLEGQALLREQENLAKSLSILATGDGPSYTIDKVYSGTTQVVAGSKVELDADLINIKTGEKNRCLVSTWSRPGLKKDAYELTFTCKDKPTIVQRHSRSVENKRVTRQIGGGVRKLEGPELESKQKDLAKSLSLLATGDGPSYTIDKVYSGTTQVVSGSLDKLDVDLIDGKTGEKSRCLVSMVSQPWLKENGYQLTFECKDKQTVVRRHSRSLENEKPAVVLGGYKELTGEELIKEQENLAKSLSILATGDGPSYTIDKVYSGNFQLVAGTLVKLDADLIDGKTGEKNRCLVSIWTQLWLKEDGYELTFDCKDKEKVVKHHS